MDNYYNSFELAKILNERQTYCTGTLRADRKNNPKDVIKAKLRTGETKALYSQGILIGKWKDKRDVLYISTEFVNDMVETTNKRGQTKTIPLPIVKYNEYMSGIDTQDQMMSYYPCSRKTLRWYKKLGIHVLQLLLLNSYLLFNKFSGKNKMSYYDFRLSVLENLLPDRTAELLRPPRQRTIEHIPTKIDKLSAKGKTLRKKCRVCAQNKKRKDTIYHCNSCPDKPGLCLGECFKIYHATS